MDVAQSPAPGAESGKTYTLVAGDYVVSEDVFPGYTASYSGSDSSGKITLSAGDNKTVTITNDDIAVTPTTATLRVIKHVINNDGGTKAAANFKLHVKTSGKDVAQSPAPGAESGKTYTLVAGTYAVSEGDDTAGYKATYSGDSDANGIINLAPGENKTVTITNNDIALPTPVPAKAILHVIKHVINNNGGTAVAANFKLHVKTSGKDVSKSPAPGVESPGNTYTLAAGTYVISENTYAGYKASFSGDGSVSGKITLAPGDNKTIIITNNDIATSPIISDNSKTTSYSHYYRRSNSENFHTIV